MNEKIKHLINYIMGSFLTKGLSFLSIPILTRLLTPKDYGIISIYESLVLILISIIGLGISSGISRYYFESKKNMEIFLKSNILFIFFYGLLISTILFNLSNFIADKIELDVKIIKLSIVASVFGVVFDIYQRLLMSCKKSKEYNISSMIKSIITLLLTIILAYFLKEKFYSKIYSVIIFGIIFVIFLILRYKEYFCTAYFETKYIKYALTYSIPLIPATLSNFILAYFDRIAISNITGDLIKTGLYSFAYNVGMIQQVIVLSIINTLRPYFYEYLNLEKYIEINKMVKKYVDIVYISAIVLILFSREIVMLIARAEYYEALELIPIIIIGYIFVFFYTVYFQYASYSKRTITISINTFLAGILNIYLNYKYIPLYGYKAAALTTVISYFALFILHYCNSKYYLKARVIPLKIFAKDFIIFIILSLLSFYLLELKNNLIVFVSRLFLASITLYIYFVRKNKHLIKREVKKIFQGKQ